MFPKNEDGKRLELDRDLEEYGIFRLTGEACKIGQRALCDLSPEGVELMENMLSVKFTDTNNSWNHQNFAKIPNGWKSMMIPWSMMMEIMVFVLAKEYKYVARVEWRVPWARANYVEGFNDDEEWAQFREAANKVYVSDDRTPKEVQDGAEPRTRPHWWMYISPDGKLRNRHAWTGRAE